MDRCGSRGVSVVSEALQPLIVVLAVPVQGSVCRSACAKAGVVPQPAVGGETRAGVAYNALVASSSSARAG